MTRGTVLEQLNITLAELKQLETKGIVHVAMRDVHGWRLYHEEDIDRLRKPSAANSFSSGPNVLLPSTAGAQEDPEKSRRTDKAAAPEAPRAPSVSYTTEAAIRVFKLLKDGTKLVDVVLETNLHPTVVDAIAREFTNFSGCMMLSSAAVDAINKLPIDGELPLPDENALLDILRRYVNARCTSCRKKPSATRCLSCIRESERRSDDDDTDGEMNLPPARAKISATHIDGRVVLEAMNGSAHHE